MLQNLKNKTKSNNILPITNNNNTYIVKWYNALTGLEYQTSYEQSSNSSIKINIPLVAPNDKVYYEYSFGVGNIFKIFSRSNQSLKTLSLHPQDTLSILCLHLTR